MRTIAGRLDSRNGALRPVTSKRLKGVQAATREVEEQWADDNIMLSGCSANCRRAANSLCWSQSGYAAQVQHFNFAGQLVAQGVRLTGYAPAHAELG